MYNVICLIISLVITFILIGISVYIKGKKNFNVGYSYLFYSCLCMIEWVVCNAMSYTSTNDNTIIFWFCLRIIGLAIMPVTLFLFSIEFNKLGLDFSSNVIKIFFIIPALTIVLVLTNNVHHLMYTSINVISENNAKFVIGTPDKWGHLHMIYSNSLYFISLLLFLYKKEDDDKVAQKRKFIFFIGFLIIIVSMFFDFFDLLGKYNFTFIGPTFATFLFYKGLVTYPNNDFSDVAKNTVFEKISSMAIVSDNDGTIVQYNNSAKETFAFMNIEIDGANYDNLIKTWLVQSNGYIEKNDAGQMISVQKAGKRYYYQLTQSKIKDSRGTVFGTFTELSNITMQQESIQELFKLVNTDQLTGLYNRRYFDDMCVKYDKEVFYPLVIFSGDLNRLKFTNDTYGHACGDRLIQLISKVLKTAAPKGSVICRHGGDEFSVIIPNSSKGMAIDFIRRVDKICQMSAEEPFGAPSISLGYAFKENRNQDIKEIIEEADKMMYEVKARKHNIADGIEVEDDFHTLDKLL